MIKQISEREVGIRGDASLNNQGGTALFSSIALVGTGPQPLQVKWMIVHIRPKSTLGHEVNARLAQGDAALLKTWRRLWVYFFAMRRVK
jgi:hypothetical protein